MNRRTTRTKTGSLLLASIVLAPLAAASVGQSTDPPAESGLSLADVEKSVTAGMFCALVISPDRETAWGYSTDSGRWAKTWVNLPDGEIKKFIKSEYAAVEADDAIHMFSKNTVSWTSLPRKRGVPFKWIQQGESMAIVAMGTSVYIYSPRTAAWSSVDLLGE